MNVLLGKWFPMTNGTTGNGIHAANNEEQHKLMVIAAAAQMELAQGIRLFQHLALANFAQNSNQQLPPANFMSLSPTITPADKITANKTVVTSKSKSIKLNQPSLNVQTVTYRNASSNAKKYCCDICHRTFSRSNTLVTHRRIHTGEKPFQCAQCGRAFRQPGNLTRHIHTHTTAKPFVCRMCGKEFNRVGNLQTHLALHRSCGK